MKKQIIAGSRSVGTGLNLSKRTISNLSTLEMNRQLGGRRTYSCEISDYCTHSCPNTNGRRCQ